MSYLHYAGILLAICFLAFNAQAQEGERPFQSADTLGILSPSVLSDTLPPDQVLARDSLPPDSTQLADTVKVPEGDIKTTIQYHADDSIYFDVAKQIIHLYGNGHIDYGEISLDAAYIQIDWVNNMLTAQGMPDSTGAMAGQPIFKEGSEEYQTEHIRYNFKTRRAYITSVLTKPQAAEGYVYGETVKKNEFNEVFIKKGWYTTCDCEPGDIPDFYIKSRKMKVVPGNLVVSGPFNIVIADVPTPLGLPFGIFPMPRRQNSGIIIPTYGEERIRGFFLRNGGYYFDINDYINLTLLGSIYSKGSYGFQVVTDYNKRYAYSGGLNFQYNKQKLDVDSNNPQESNDFSVTYRHAPFSRGVSRFSASVNIMTNSFTRNNPSPSVYRNLRTTLNSSIMYSTAFRNTPFNLSLSFRHNQNLVTGVFNVTLPDISLNMNRIYPFKDMVRSNSSWLSKVNVGYTLTGSNQLSNDRVSFSSKIPLERIANLNPLADSVLPVNQENLREILSRSEIGFRHQVPISTSFSLLKFFTMSPSFQYEELWYLKRLDYNYLEDERKVDINTIPGFNRAYSWSVGAGTTTRVYGLYTFKGDKKVQAIRHTVIPSIGFSYRPDFSAERYGYYQTVRINAGEIPDPYAPFNNRNYKVVSIYDGFLYGAPSPGKSGAISFSVNNNLEMKVRNDKDTAQDAKSTKKIPILESLSFSSSYNIIADSFNLSPINISARTRLFQNKINVSTGMVVDPYSYDLDIYNPYDTLRDGTVYQNYTREDRYAWRQGAGEGFMPRIGTITSANISFNTSLTPKSKKDTKEQAPEEETPASILEEDLDYRTENRQDYVDFDVPWSLSLRYSLNYSFDPRRRLIKEGSSDRNNSRVRQSVMFNGDVSIAPKWKIGFESGFDFQQKDITQTGFHVNRDLGCFEMRFDWIPFGRFTSYYVQINVKSAMLSDLKLQRRRAWQDF